MIRLAYSFLRHWKRYRQFPHDCYGGFRGVYDSFEEAIVAAPKTKPLGYDNERLASWYVNNLKAEIHENDYPILFWLNDLLRDGSTVFDFGGNVGTYYLQYKRYFHYGNSLKWTVCDLPMIVKAGKANNSEANLYFTENAEEANGTDIFLASGSLQYIDDFATMIGSLERKPKHLLINRLPLYDGKRFVTLQNGGEVFYPQYVFNKNEFISSLEKLGYEVKDLWKDFSGGCFIPFKPKKNFRHYGLYLILKALN